MDTGRRQTRMLATVAAGALLLGACADDGEPTADGGTTPPAATSEPTPTTEPTSGTTDDGAASGAADATITIEDFSFGDPVTVPVGATVEVVNADGVAHTWTADDGAFDSGSLAPDESFTYVAETEGTFAFTCTIHPSMTGTLTVGAAGDAAAPTGPARIVAEDQTSDGSTVVVAEVELATDGYVVIHADGGGSPGAVIGHSDLLPSGTSTDVAVTLDEPLSGSATVFPMAHVDADGDGVYEFAPPEDTTDVPATTADGEVAVVAIAVTLE